MGKTAKKVAKKQQEKNAVVKKENILRGKEQVMQLRDLGKYEAGLELAADLMGQGCKDADLLSVVAEFYFMAEDYKRAADWIDRTLEKQPQNIEARIVLIRICMLNERHQEALSISELILKKYVASLTKQQIDGLKEILEFYKLTEAALLQEKYPFLDHFLRDKKECADSNEQSEVPAQSVKKTALQIKHEILIQNISTQEKVEYLNFSAGVFYRDDLLTEAKELLTAALEIDTHNEMILKNIAFVEIECGNKPQAVQYASQMTHPDFELLYFIKKMK